MGWDYQHVEKGTKTADILLPQFRSEWDVLDHAQVGSTFYAVARSHKDGEVVAFVILTDRRSRDYFNFGYKDITWTMGPTESACPNRLLDLLPEPPNEYAAEWVVRCRKHNAQLDLNKKIKPGQTVRLAEPLHFTDGQERDTFTYIEKSEFRSDDGVRVRITGWKKRPFTLVA